MPNFAVNSPSLSPSTDIRDSTSYTHTNNSDATANTTVDSKPIIISSTHTTPSDISTSTALTVGSGNITTTHQDIGADTDADPGHSGQSTRTLDNQPETLRARIKQTMTDNQLVINTFIAGGLAGATSRTVVSPLERLKIIL